MSIYTIHANSLSMSDFCLLEALALLDVNMLRKG
jgi:hypothetical protein